MAENHTPNQRLNPNQHQTQSPMLRKPPSAGGPKRIPEEQTAQPARKRSKWAKAYPYLIAGTSTGIGVGYALNVFLS